MPRTFARAQPPCVYRHKCFLRPYMYTDYVDGAIAGAHLSTWKTSRGSWCTLKSRDARSLWPWYWILDRLVTGSASFHVGAVYCFLVPRGMLRCFVRACFFGDTMPAFSGMLPRIPRQCYVGGCCPVSVLCSCLRCVHMLDETNFSESQRGHGNRNNVGCDPEFLRRA